MPLQAATQTRERPVFRVDDFTMTIADLIEDAIERFEAENGVTPNVIFLGRSQLAELKALVSKREGGPVPDERAIRRPNYNDIAIAEMDAESHVSVDRLTGSEWPI